MSQPSLSLAQAAESLSLVANETQSQQEMALTAKALNLKLVDICKRSIEQAFEAPPVIKDWRDMETARKVLAAASGTDTQKPAFNLIFPPSLEGQSSEAPRYIRISDIIPANPLPSPAQSLAPVFDALPAIALHAVEAHSRALEETTGRGGRGKSADALS